jgi:hypothetical protein
MARRSLVVRDDRGQTPTYAPRLSAVAFVVRTFIFSALGQGIPRSKQQPDKFVAALMSYPNPPIIEVVSRATTQRGGNRLLRNCPAD